MPFFGWGRWLREASDFKKFGQPSMERWFLRYFHSEHALEEIAWLLRPFLATFHSEVSIKSVWIDGTPQATGTTLSGKAVKCELADLLYIVQEVDTNNTVLCRRGILLQAKIAKSFAKLCGGRSTSKERDLLECLDRRVPLCLFKDTAGKLPIGTVCGKKPEYIFTNISPSSSRPPPSNGLSDCAAYLLIPKQDFSLAAWWPSPFLVGWPCSRMTSIIYPPWSFGESVIGLYKGPALGMQVLDVQQASKCDWSRMVWDLLGHYKDVVMNTGDNRPRIREHSQCIFLSSGSLHVHKSGAFIQYDQLPPSGGDDRRELPDTPPNISAVVVTIKSADSRKD